jgi:hypothetical protein
MKLTTTLFAALIFMFGSLSPSSAAFITFGPTVKVVFTQVVVNGFTVTQAESTVIETDQVTGLITAKRQTEVIVPDGAGGFTKKVTEETTLAIPDGGGTFTVVTGSNLIETPLDASEDPTGAPVTTGSPTVFGSSVAEAALNLPTSTEFVPNDEELDTVIVVSPL